MLSSGLGAAPAFSGTSADQAGIADEAFFGMSFDHNL
jgi:hypothetical protein